MLINRDVLEASAQLRQPDPVRCISQVLHVRADAGRRSGYGVVSLQDLDREDAFSEADVRLLETLASSMSVALENARLFDETQTAGVSEALEQQTATGDILSVIAARCSRCPSSAPPSWPPSTPSARPWWPRPTWTKMIQLVGDELLEIFDPDIAYVALLDPRVQHARLPVPARR